MLGRDYKNKVKTVMALQNNFTVVSKLCQSEQREKEKVLLQSQSFKAQLNEHIDKCCELYDQIEMLQKQVDAMKQKALAGEKAGIEIQKLQQLLKKERDQRSAAEAAAERSQK